MVVTQRETNALSTKKSVTGISDPVFPAQSGKMPLQSELPAKLRRCTKKIVDIIHFLKINFKWHLKASKI